MTSAMQMNLNLKYNFKKNDQINYNIPILQNMKTNFQINLIKCKQNTLDISLN